MRAQAVLVSLAVILVVLRPDAASASSIGLANTYFRSWNGVLVHRLGDTFSSFLVNEATETSGPGAMHATDLGFATVDAQSLPLSLHAASAVDATDIAALGYAYVIAEASTWYEADLIVSGGSGVVDILLEANQSDVSFTNDNKVSIDGTRSIRIFDGSTAIYGMSSLADFDRVQLEYNIPYRIQLIFTASSLAHVGHQTSNMRDLELSLTIVPEEGTGTLLAVGLALLGLCGSRPTRCCT